MSVSDVALAPVQSSPRGIFLPRISSPARAQSNRRKPEPERRTCRPPAGEKQDTFTFSDPNFTGKLLWRKVDGSHRGSGDTHAEDVQAHRSFDALLVGEVIFGELVDRCGADAQMDWVYWDRVDRPAWQSVFDKKPQSVKRNHRE